MESDYKLSRNRFKELKHFCLQYPEWVESYLELGGRASNGHDDVTATDAVKRTDYIRAIELIETTAKDTDSIFGELVLKAVTQDKSISELGIQCDKDIFQYYLKKFYWLLSQRKGI